MSIIYIGTVVMFVVCLGLSYFLYKEKKIKNVRKTKLQLLFIENEKKYNRSIRSKQLFILVGGSILLSYFKVELLFQIIIIVVFLIGVPSMYYAEEQRKRKEHIFNSIISYCSNISVELKRTKVAFTALKNIIPEVDDPLKKDLLILLKAFENEREEVEKIMLLIEKKYPYSILHQLHIILLQMNFEDSSKVDRVIGVYMDDVEALATTVRKNMYVRNSLKMKLIMLTVCSVVTYWFFYDSMKNQLGDKSSYYIFQNIFFIAIGLSTYLMIIYFNKHTTKE